MSEVVQKYEEMEGDYNKPRNRSIISSSEYYMCFIYWYMVFRYLYVGTNFDIYTVWITQIE